MYPLGDLMESIRVSLGASLPGDTAESDPMAVLWYRGRAQLYHHCRPPRYCWFPENILPESAYKGSAYGDKVAVSGGVEIVVVHSWGADEEQAWTLRHNLIAQAKLKWDANVKYRGCEWDEGGDMQYGFGFATRLAFDIPIIGETYAIASPATIGSTGIIVINGSETQSCGG